MFVRRNIFKTVTVFILIMLCALTVSPISAAAETQTIYLGGFPAGFTLNTTTVEVIGICEVMTEDGMRSPARECGIKTGDVIEKINGVEVNSTQDINTILQEEYKKFEVTIQRNGEFITMEVNPATDITTKTRRLGILVKDSINGIGTVTYIDKANNKFASLGHPVADINGSLIPINGGTVYGCFIYDVKKGVKGTPGELRGAFDSTSIIGKATLNCACGIYGDLSADFDTSKLIKVEKGKIDDVKMGKACIYSTLDGGEPKKYEISIVKVDKHNKDNRNFVIKMDDENLLNKSGGIVQGMSGSPIVQNGKIIGAVTHVFVNDPTRGYGIGIDNMLNSY